MTIVRNGDACSCGNNGCWEAYASGTAFARRARKRVESAQLNVLAGGLDAIDLVSSANSASATDSASLSPLINLTNLSNLSSLPNSISAIDSITGQAVFEAAARGETYALDLVSEEAELLGIGIANLLHLYSPEAIVVGGGMSTHLDVLLPGICAKVCEAAMKGFEDIPILRASLDGNSGLIGAAALVFDSFPATSQSSLCLA